MLDGKYPLIEIVMMHLLDVSGEYVMDDVKENVDGNVNEMLDCDYFSV